MDEISNEPVIDRHGNKTTRESFNSIYMMADSVLAVSATPDPSAGRYARFDG